MIGPGTGVRVYLACGVTDMRKGIAGLSALTQDVLRQKPASGAVFAFRGRRGDRIKLLYWDGQGFCLYYKVLERGRFPWPNAQDGAVRMTSAQLAMLWEGIDWRRPDWRAPPALRRRPRVSDETLRERRELDLGTCCPDCGGDLRVVGEDVSELLDMIAAQMKVIQIARIKKSCRRCEKMVQEPAPSRPISGSMAGPNLLAHILVSKFDDHLPLYRQHEIFARMGADIPESTLVGWCGRAMKTLLPLIERIEADIMGSDLLHAPSRDIATQYPAGQWMTHRSGCWIALCATRGWAEVSNKAGSGPMCAINALGRGHRHRVQSIALRQTGRKSMFSAIWPTPARRSTGSASSTTLSATSMVNPLTSAMPRVKS